MSRERFKSEEQKSALENIKLIVNHEKLLSNFSIIILQLYLMLNAKQNMEKDSKY